MSSNNCDDHFPPTPRAAPRRAVRPNGAICTRGDSLPAHRDLLSSELVTSHVRLPLVVSNSQKADSSSTLMRKDYKCIQVYQLHPEWTRFQDNRNVNLRFVVIYQRRIEGLKEDMTCCFLLVAYILMRIFPFI